jgi:hypothetical protein
MTIQNDKMYHVSISFRADCDRKALEAYYMMLETFLNDPELEKGYCSFRIEQG